VYKSGKCLVAGLYSCKFNLILIELWHRTRIINSVILLLCPALAAFTCLEFHKSNCFEWNIITSLNSILIVISNSSSQGQFAPIKGNYSPGFRQLVRDLLQRDPEFRPTAAEVGEICDPVLPYFGIPEALNATSLFLFIVTI